MTSTVGGVPGVGLGTSWARAKMGRASSRANRPAAHGDGSRAALEYFIDGFLTSAAGQRTAPRMNLPRGSAPRRRGSEGRRVGKESGETWRSWGEPYY